MQNDALELQLRRRVVPHRVHRLRGRRRGAQQIRIGRALGKIVGGREAERRHFLLLHILVDGIELEGRKRAEDHIDLVALDQFLGLGLGAGRVAAGIGGDEVHLAAADRIIFFLQIGQDALLHLNAALGERTGLHRQQAELERRGLRDRRRRELG